MVAELVAIESFQISQMSPCLKKLAAIKEPNSNGTLDHTAVLFGSGMGYPAEAAHDSDEFQQAIDDVNAAGGGHVMVGSGTLLKVKATDHWSGTLRGSKLAGATLSVAEAPVNVAVGEGSLGQFPASTKCCLAVRKWLQGSRMLVPSLAVRGWRSA